MFRVIIDTDPGIDDDLALFLALTSPDVQQDKEALVNRDDACERITEQTLLPPGKSVCSVMRTGQTL